MWHVLDEKVTNNGYRKLLTQKYYCDCGEKVPIKSLYVPTHAMQGEEIPGHILWDSLECSLIKVQLPEQIKVKALYNVEEGMYEISDNEANIKQVAIDGYLGMLFSTRKLEECFAKVKMKFSFFDKNRQKIVDESRVIQLFRPQLEVVEVPEVITVDPDRNYVSGRIKTRKLGQGTLVLNFTTPNESELQSSAPNNIMEFLKNFKRDFKENLTELQDSFPEYSSSISNYVRFFVDGWTNYAELDELKEAAEDLYAISTENERFAEAFFEALGKSLASNIKLFTLPENLLKYLDSVLSKRVWLTRPWQIIPVSTEPRIFILEILPTDRILDRYEWIRLRPIKIQGKSEGYIEIARLFEWGE